MPRPNSIIEEIRGEGVACYDLDSLEDQLTSYELELTQISSKQTSTLLSAQRIVVGLGNYLGRGVRSDFPEYYEMIQRAVEAPKVNIDTALFIAQHVTPEVAYRELHPDILTTFLGPPLVCGSLLTSTNRYPEPDRTLNILSPDDMQGVSCSLPPVSFALLEPPLNTELPETKVLDHLYAITQLGLSSLSDGGTLLLHVPSAFLPQTQILISRVVDLFSKAYIIKPIAADFSKRSFWIMGVGFKSDVYTYVGPQLARSLATGTYHGMPYRMVADTVVKLVHEQQKSLLRDMKGGDAPIQEELWQLWRPLFTIVP